MNRLPKKDDRKEIRFQSEPLCLFYFPEKVTLLPAMRATYIGTLPKGEIENEVAKRKRWKNEEHRKHHVKTKDNEEIWSKKRTQVRQARKRTRKPIRHLKSYLFTSVNYEKVSERTVLPSLFEVLETVKDAWPPPPPPLPPPPPPSHPPSRKNFSFQSRQEDQKPALPDLTKNKMILSKGKMKEEMYLQFPSPLINRRFSMPEELMRKYFIMKEKTSEESETVKTMDEMTTTSSSTSTTTSVSCKTARRKPPKIVQTQQQVESTETTKSVKTTKPADSGANADAQRTPPLLHRSVVESSEVKDVSKHSHTSQKKTVIKVKEVSGKCYKSDVCKCNSEKVSSGTTTISPKEETDENGTTESMASSSPVQLPKQESPSELISSDSVHCTCRELTSSKTTSTDIFHSGKSTLSQTVSDKSVSTQDSTVSLRSVSTRGSSTTDNSNATTSETEKTSAKESTMSDNTPRTCQSILHRNYQREREGGCCTEEFQIPCPNSPKIQNFQTGHCIRRCPMHSPPPDEFFENHGCFDANTNAFDGDCCVKNSFIGGRESTYEPSEDLGEDETGEAYTWAKLTHDELYMMQQLRHQKLMDNQFEMTVDNETDTYDTMTLEYEETENTNSRIVIPRYSALPRTLSMLVNTSSPDNSIQNSDSDSQSLTDSLEDQPIGQGQKYHFDTRKESKPVRGDVSLTEAKVFRPKVPKGKAFFVSIKDPFGEGKMLESIEKIPKPPKKIRNHIDERHSNLNSKHKHSHENLEIKLSQKKKKTKSLKEDREKTGKIRKKEQVYKKENRKSEFARRSMRKEPKTKENGELSKSTDSYDLESEKHFRRIEVDKPKKIGKRKNEFKENRGRFLSKIPVLVSIRSNSSSDREDDNTECIQQTNPFSSVVETTQIMEIARTDKGVSLQIPQQTQQQSKSADFIEQTNKKPLMMPSLLPDLKQHSFLNQPFNRSLFPVVQSKRSPGASKYRQRFEVIPEEKSSSLSSTEDTKTTVETLPKFATVGTSPLPLKEKPERNGDRSPFKSCNISEIPNLIMAQVEDKKIKTLPYLKGTEEQKIILFSSEPRNSIKGREALIAMNREDFNRLAKGWINFYKLKETGETSDVENLADKDGKKKTDRNGLKSVKEKETNEKAIDGVKTPTKSAGEVKEDQKNYNLEKAQNFNDSSLQTIQKRQQAGTNLSEENATNRNHQSGLDENIRFYSSNTILRSRKTISPTESRWRDKMSPDQRLTPERPFESENPKPSSSSPAEAFETTEGDEEYSDSDSTDYMEPPTPRVPPLLLEDIPSDATISSGESELDDGDFRNTTDTLKSCQMSEWETKKKTKMKKETYRRQTKKDSGWSVTVAGTVELSKSEPDLEMKLSFPVKRKPSALFRSDSGFGETSICSKITELTKNSKTDSYDKQIVDLGKSSSQKWTVVAETPNQAGNGQNHWMVKPSKKPSHRLPDLESSRFANTEKVLKNPPRKKVVAQKLYAIWPKIQKIIQEEFGEDDYRLTTGFPEDLDETCLLSVRGTSIYLEKKEKPLTMTQRDVTGRYTSRQGQT